MVDLGLLYENGRGVAQDYAKAREWYEKAAAKDNAYAMRNLGLLYENGRGDQGARVVREGRCQGLSVTDAWMSGRGAYYVEMIAKHGLVAIHTASSSPLVAPPGGIRPVLGTNPIAIAVPSSRGPIVLDMGTSAYMMTEVMLRERLGELLPEGVALGPREFWLMQLISSWLRQ